MLSPHLSYTLHLTISVSLFLQLVFQWNDVYIFGMILFDACPDCINVIRMDQKAIPQAALPSVSRGAGAIRLGRPCLSRSSWSIMPCV